MPKETASVNTQAVCRKRVEQAGPEKAARAPKGDSGSMRAHSTRSYTMIQSERNR